MVDISYQRDIRRRRATKHVLFVKHGMKCFATAVVALALPTTASVRDGALEGVVLRASPSNH